MPIPSALLCGLAGLDTRPVFGAFNIPAMRLALAGIPTYPRSVLITRDELGDELAAAMGDSTVCVLCGHGVAVTGPTVASAVANAVNLDTLVSVTVSLARLGAEPEDLPADDLAELPDLGPAFNHELAWRALVARYDRPVAGHGEDTG